MVILNENDHKVLGFCKNFDRSVNEVARFLNISPASVSTRINKLEKADLIVVNKKGHGKKTYIRTKKAIKTKEHFLTILKEIKRRGGVTEEEYSTIIPPDFSNPEEYDKFNAITTLPYLRPKLIQRKIFLTKEGEKFIKENGGKE